MLRNDLRIHYREEDDFVATCGLKNVFVQVLVLVGQIETGSNPTVVEN